MENNWNKVSEKPEIGSFVAVMTYTGKFYCCTYSGNGCYVNENKSPKYPEGVTHWTILPNINNE